MCCVTLSQKAYTLSKGGKMLLPTKSNMQFRIGTVASPVVTRTMYVMQLALFPREGSFP